MIRALARSDVDRAQALLGAGASPDEMGRFDKNNQAPSEELRRARPLSIAAEREDIRSLRALLAAGADPNLVDQPLLAPGGRWFLGEFTSPLERAVKAHWTKGAKELLDAGANPLALSGGRPLLARAAEWGVEELTRAMLAATAVWEDRPRAARAISAVLGSAIARGDSKLVELIGPWRDEALEGAEGRGVEGAQRAIASFLDQPSATPAAKKLRKGRERALMSSLEVTSVEGAGGLREHAEWAGKCGLVRFQELALEMVARAEAAAIDGGCQEASETARAAARRI